MLSTPPNSGSRPSIDQVNDVERMILLFNGNPVERTFFDEVQYLLCVSLPRSWTL